jgi:hypothetical protein
MYNTFMCKRQKHALLKIVIKKYVSSLLNKSLMQDDAKKVLLVKYLQSMFKLDRNKSLF